MARSQSPAKLYNRRKRRVRHWQSLCRSRCHLPTIGMLNMRYFWVHCFSLELFSCFVLRCKKVVFRWKVSFLEMFFVNVLKKFMVFRWKSKLSSNEKPFHLNRVSTKNSSLMLNMGYFYLTKTSRDLNHCQHIYID